MFDKDYKTDFPPMVVTADLKLAFIIISMIIVAVIVTGSIQVGLVVNVRLFRKLFALKT